MKTVPLWLRSLIPLFLILVTVLDGRPVSDGRLEASFLVARGRMPTESERAAWSGRAEGSSFGELLERHREAIEEDPEEQKGVRARAWRDAFGIVPESLREERSNGRAGKNYREQLQGHLERMRADAETYEAVIHRAYRRVLRRDAYAEELTYWENYDVIPFHLLAASVENWAWRNQPGLMSTAGVPTVTVNSDYLRTQRVAPRVADQIRVALGEERTGPPEENPAAFGRNVIAIGAEGLLSTGRIHFVAAGNS